MPTITSETTVSPADASATVTTEDLVLQASIEGSLALRQLVYPDATVLAPFTYDKNPDEWTNFDLTPMVKRPSVGVLRTLEDTKLTGWLGYAKDDSIVETWRGSDTEASISLDFLRQLYAYYENPPTSGFIVWKPRDRTVNSYNIMIESLTVGGSDIKFNYLASLHNLITGDVNLRFRIVSQV